MKILMIEKPLPEKKIKEIERIIKRRLETGVICKKNPIYLIDSTDMGKSYFIKFSIYENSPACAYKCFKVLNTKENRKKYRSDFSYKVDTLNLKFSLNQFIKKSLIIYPAKNLQIIHQNIGWQQLCNIYKYICFNVDINIDNKISNAHLRDEYNVLCNCLDATNHDFSLSVFAYMLFSKCKSLFKQYAQNRNLPKKNFALHIKGSTNSNINDNIIQYISYLNEIFFDSTIFNLGNSLPTEVDKKFVLPYIKTPFYLSNAKLNIKDISVFLYNSSHKKFKSKATNVCQTKLDYNLGLPISFIYFNVNQNSSSFLNIFPPSDLYTKDFLSNDNAHINNQNYVFEDLINDYIKYIEYKVSDEVKEMDKKYKDELYEKMYEAFYNDATIPGYIEHFIREMININGLTKSHIKQFENLIVKLRYCDFVYIFDNCKQYNGKYGSNEWKRFVKTYKSSLHNYSYSKIANCDKSLNKLSEKMQKRYREVLLNEYLTIKNYRSTFFDNLYKEAGKILKNKKSYPIQVKRWSFLLASMISFKNYVDKRLPEKSENFDKYFQEFKDIAIQMCNMPSDKNIDNAMALSEFSVFLKNQIDNNAIIDAELGTDSEIGWIDCQKNKIYLKNTSGNNFYNDFQKYLIEHNERIEISKQAFVRDILDANCIINARYAGGSKRYDYERKIGDKKYRVLVLDCERLNIQ